MNTGNIECISFNLETAQIEIAYQKYWHSTVWPLHRLCNFFDRFFSNHKKVNMTTLWPIKWGAAGVVTFCLCWRRPFPGHSCRVSEYHHSVRLPSGSFNVFTFKWLVGQSMWKWHQYAKDRRIHTLFFYYSYIKQYFHLLPKNCTYTVTA